MHAWKPSCVTAEHCIRGHTPEVGRNANGDCNACNAERAREWRETNRERRKAYRREYIKRVRREALLAYGDGTCASCGHRPDDVLNLELDHVNGDGKAHRLTLTGRNSGDMNFLGALRRAGWPLEPPLQTLCVDCHKAKSNEERAAHPRSGRLLWERGVTFSTLAERAASDGFGDQLPFTFFGDWPSNFSRHPVVLPCPFTGVRTTYPTGEHRFQAMKATTLADHDAVLYEPHPSKAKDRGRSILLRDGWGSNYGDLCWYVMTEVTTAKAVQHVAVAQALLATGGRPIYEDSPTDDIWGVRSGATFDGKNLLGRSWMWTRYAIAALFR